MILLSFMLSKHVHTPLPSHPTHVDFESCFHLAAVENCPTGLALYRLHETSPTVLSWAVLRASFAEQGGSGTPVSFLSYSRGD